MKSIGQFTRGIVQGIEFVSENGLGNIVKSNFTCWEKNGDRYVGRVKVERTPLVYRDHLAILPIMIVHVNFRT